MPVSHSYDTRGAHAGTPSEWHDMEVLENRARLDKNTGPAVLIIDPVTEKDAGNFRCRVDFKLSPTRNSNVNLEVIGKSRNFRSAAWPRIRRTRSKLSFSLLLLL